MSREVIQKELGEGHKWKHGMAEAKRFTLRMIAGLMSLAFLWIIFSRFVVPTVIESAYRGESVPFLNSIISGQAIHPLEHYLAHWEIISWSILGILVMIGLIPIPLLATRPEVQSYDARGSGSPAIRETSRKANQYGNGARNVQPRDRHHL